MRDKVWGKLFLMGVGLGAVAVLQLEVEYISWGLRVGAAFILAVILARVLDHRRRRR